MLRIRFETEDWRECLSSFIDEAETDFGVESDVTSYDAAADELRCDTLCRLDDSGVEYQRCYAQTKGSFVIVQSGDDQEIDAFYEAIESQLPAARDAVRRIAKNAAAAE